MLDGEEVAFCSDAGMPGISDPGCVLVDAAREAGVPVDVLPGPSAVTTALVASGFKYNAFYFGGFLPRKEAERTALLESLANLDAALVFYESPHRVTASAAFIAQAYGARPVALCRELTKLHEEVLRLPADGLAANLAARDAIKGGVFNAGSAGYINGDMHCGYQVLHSIPAWRGGQADFMPQAPGQVVQYVSAHDNYTLWDLSLIHI